MQYFVSTRTHLNEVQEILGPWLMNADVHRYGLNDNTPLNIKLKPALDCCPWCWSTILASVCHAGLCFTKVKPILLKWIISLEFMITIENKTLEGNYCSNLSVFLMFKPAWHGLLLYLDKAKMWKCFKTSVTITCTDFFLVYDYKRLVIFFVVWFQLYCYLSQKSIQPSVTNLEDSHTDIQVHCQKEQQ